MRILTASLAVLVASCMGTAPQAAPRSGAATAAGTPTADNIVARDVLKELVEINTTESVGDMTRAANAVAARLKAAGFPAGDVQVLGEDARHGNLVARLRGKANATKRPILLLAHLDVVEAKREDWSFDPFVFREEGGYFYGRGVSDDKDMASIWVANLLRMKRERFVPDRDIIVALTTDEEGGPANGVDWLLANHRELVDAAYALNEGGGGEIKNGKYLANELQTSEKLFASYEIEARNKGGHSSIPPRDNAIYRLANALVRVGAFEFPVELNDTTRAYFDRMAAKEGSADMKAVTRSPPDPAAAARLSATPYYNALLRTTCVATMATAGHAENALPQSAKATVNCRILPGVDPKAVEASLRAAVNDPDVTVRPVRDQTLPSSPSPLVPEVLVPVERITRAMWPGVPVVPTMSTGATDGARLRRVGIPCYGVSGEFADVDDVRAHGKDERLGVRQLYEGQEFLYRLVKELAGAR